jgi:3-hydroxyacyl-[acyl-carrier-protein] dehydratase|tara:strand:- start:84902 stop:85327 length:426 start_codon:yes stop_codon:yes gene_type:complete
MTFPQPANILPHRDPFLFITEITDLQKNESAEAIWVLDGSEYFFQGHFPGRPTLPGVLMCESIAQLGAYVVLQDNRFKDKLPLFGGLENARFRQQVIPGDILTLRVEVLRLSSRGGKAYGEASVNGKLACSADLMFVAVER